VAQTTWATSTDVQQVTGVEVTDQQVTIAGFVIDNYTGRPYAFQWVEPSTDEVITYEWWQKVGAADSYYLRLAVCYQTVWMLAQPDIMQRMDVREIPTTREPLRLEANAMVLGPIAKKALSRVSWLRSRAIHVRSPFEDLYTANAVNFGEWIFPWSPIGGGFGYPGGPDY
jgi:hypothetical protein